MVGRCSADAKLGVKRGVEASTPAGPSRDVNASNEGPGKGEARGGGGLRPALQWCGPPAVMSLGSRPRSRSPPPPRRRLPAHDATLGRPVAVGVVGGLHVLLGRRRTRTSGHTPAAAPSSRLAVGRPRPP